MQTTSKEEGEELEIQSSPADEMGNNKRRILLLRNSLFHRNLRLSFSHFFPFDTDFCGKSTKCVFHLFSACMHVCVICIRIGRQALHTHDTNECFVYVGHTFVGGTEKQIDMQAYRQTRTHTHTDTQLRDTHILHFHTKFSSQNQIGRTAHALTQAHKHNTHTRTYTYTYALFHSKTLQIQYAYTQIKMYQKEGSTHPPGKQLVRPGAVKTMKETHNGDDQEQPTQTLEIVIFY